MRFNRSAGILLHPTSLPGRYGIGDLGPAAHQWVDWLAGAGCGLWQVLPLGPTGYGDSPYQCFSALAGNPYLINPDFLLRDDLLHPNDLGEELDFNEERVDYGRVISWKLNLLERAFIRFRSHHIGSAQPLRHAYDEFCQLQSSWLDDYALFMALKEAHGGGTWIHWPQDLRKRNAQAMKAAGNALTDAVQRFTFYQFLFFRQWNELRSHVHERGLKIIGDLPIFVAMDSADVWAHPELFHLDTDGLPTVVAGVPPDYFSTTGQLWGNPLYRWDIHRSQGYSWWLERLSATLDLVDIVRVDHFRGFAAYWEIPSDSETAVNGRWVQGPGDDFFRALQQDLGQNLPIIAEDLGLITQEVIALRDRFDLPGMKVLQFAFSGMDNIFLPHHYTENCVVYTGTHDNDTSRGWYVNAPEEERKFAHDYLKLVPFPMQPSATQEHLFVNALIEAAWRSKAVFALAPMQDWLELGTEARMNYPSRLGGNWEWRMNANALTQELQDRVRGLNRRTERDHG